MITNYDKATSGRYPWGSDNTNEPPCELNALGAYVDGHIEAAFVAASNKYDFVNASEAQIKAFCDGFCDRIYMDYVQ